MRLEWLGTPALSWRDLLVIVRQSPRTTALARATFGESADWGTAEHLLAAAIDALNGANWQRAGRKGTPKPKPIPRPSTTPIAHRKSHGMSIAEYTARREARLRRA